jgi:hypothetical protein
MQSACAVLHAKRMRRIISPVAFPALYHIFSTLCRKETIFGRKGEGEGKVIEHKMRFDFLYDFRL